jgi:hypothetical protein
MNQNTGISSTRKNFIKFLEQLKKSEENLNNSHIAEFLAVTYQLHVPVFQVEYSHFKSEIDYGN